jgi:hypothetical protein
VEDAKTEGKVRVAAMIEEYEFLSQD